MTSSPAAARSAIPSWCGPCQIIGCPRRRDRYTNRSLNQGNSWRGYIDYADEMKKLGIVSLGLDDPRQGIQHVVGPETGLTQPGMLMVAGDSHTCTHGAMGCVSWGGESAQNVLLTGTVLRERARNMRVNMTGTLGPWVRRQGHDPPHHRHARRRLGQPMCGGVRRAGRARPSASKERMSICNLAIEMGAATGMVAPDDTTFEYMATREFRPRAEYWDQALAYWRTIPSDANAVFDRDETIDMSRLEPQVTWGVSPEHVIGDQRPGAGSGPGSGRETRGLSGRAGYTKLKPGDPIVGTPIDEVFIGSCSESRIDDLRLVAQVVKGRRVAPNVLAWVVPGSKPVKRQAEAEGLDRIFKEAGFDWREPGCSKCYGSNGDLVAKGKRCASNSNRNYIGRQGVDAITHLVSAPMAAAAAIAGRIVDVRRLMAGEQV